jgi:hypothetical protein
MWRPPNTTAPAEIWNSYGATGAQKGANVPRPLPAKTAKTSQKQLPTVAPITSLQGIDSGEIIETVHGPTSADDPGQRLAAALNDGHPRPPLVAQCDVSPE